MRMNTRLTIAFVLALFEFSSLGFLSLEPTRLILNHYFPRGNATDDGSASATDQFFDNAAEQGFAFTNTGWSLACSYVGLLILILFAYVYVFIKELGYGCFCTPDRYQRANQHCCTRVFGKSFLLMWFLFPIHTACLIFIIYWDIRELNAESKGVPDIRFDHHEFLTNIAFFFGDILLLKHVLAKWKALRTRDLRVSLFLETHVHLDEDDSHGHHHSARRREREILESDPGLVETAPLLPRTRSLRDYSLNVDRA